jgi:hypothetical protein
MEFSRSEARILHACQEYLPLQLQHDERMKTETRKKRLEEKSKAGLVEKKLT